MKRFLLVRYALILGNELKKLNGYLDKRVALSFMEVRNLLIIAIIPCLGLSCRTSKCAMCDLENHTMYHIEFTEKSKATNNKSEITTLFLPSAVEHPKDTNVYFVDCENIELFLHSEDKLKQFIRANTRQVGVSQIKQILTVSDADNPPSRIEYPIMIDSSVCIRQRNFLKFELRGVIGGRLNMNENIFHESYTRDQLDTLLSPNITRSKMIVGAEAALLPRAITFKNHHVFSPGIMVGVWPIDGGIYLPLAFHPRLTLKDVASPLLGQCSAWYFYGDLGIAWDLNGVVPFSSEKKINSWFTGFGFGRDIWMSRDNDFSIDVGYRFSSLALPFNSKHSKFLEENMLTHDVEYPKRQTGQFFVRFGVTW